MIKRDGLCMFVCTLSILLATFSGSVAQFNWIKDAQNPVLALGTYNDFDCSQVKQPSVIYDNGLFRMWYIGETTWTEPNRIGYAESQDGVNWMKKGLALPLGDDGEFDAMHQNTPYVLRIGSVYHMWYGGYDGYRWRIGEAVSDDGLVWDKKGAVLESGELSDSSQCSASSPCVLYVNNTYLLWYGAFDGMNWRIHMATSGDGNSWKKQGLVVDIGEEGNMDSHYVTHPEVFFDGRQYWMWYGAENGTRWTLRYCTSQDGRNWTKQGEALPNGYLNEFDNYHVADVSIIFNGENFWLWYSGATESRRWQIGLATAKAPPSRPELYPQILAIRDVPNDQGRQVRISWLKSLNDYIDSPDSLLVTHYSIWRMIDPLFRYQSGAFPAKSQVILPECDFIASIPAIQDSLYHFIAPTLADVSFTAGVSYSTFFIIAHTENARVHWDSPPERGYSIDDLSPHVPKNVQARCNENSVVIEWEIPEDTDLSYIAIYRSTLPDFNPSSQICIGFTTENVFTDVQVEPEKIYYYYVAAFDHAGNRSDLSSRIEGKVHTAIESPIQQKLKEFELEQNYPNPFNAQTKISYQMPIREHVRLSIYDLSGKEVNRLVDAEQPADHHEVIWDGRDFSGLTVCSGVYFYRLQAGSCIFLRKMLVVK